MCYRKEDIMREVFAGDLAGAYELSFDEIDLVSGGDSITVTATNAGWGNTAVQTGAGAVIGAVAGGVTGGPVGAVVGGIAGAAAGFIGSFTFSFQYNQ